MTNMNEENLVKIGLTEEQAKVYLFLVERGVAPARSIASKTGVGRALTYKVLEQLEELELVRKQDKPSTISLFFPLHPKRLKELLDRKKEVLENAENAFQKTYGSLVSSFNVLANKPNVQFYDGAEGLRIVYDDILDIGENIMVISSPIKKDEGGVLHLIHEQIQKQVAANIQTKAITPLSDGQSLVTQIEDDEKYLITRKAIPAEKLNIPSQIIIYGDKVAITNFKESFITVLIESEYIAKTFKIMFEHIWSHH